MTSIGNKFKYANLMNFGKPKNTGISIASDDDAYNLHPGEYGFYMQFMSALNDANPLLIETIFNIIGNSKYTLDRLNNSISEIMKTFKFALKHENNDAEREERIKRLNILLRSNPLTSSFYIETDGDKTDTAKDSKGPSSGPSSGPSGGPSGGPSSGPGSGPGSGPSGSPADLSSTHIDVVVPGGPSGGPSGGPVVPVGTGEVVVPGEEPGPPGVASGLVRETEIKASHTTSATTNYLLVQSNNIEYKHLSFSQLIKRADIRKDDISYTVLLGEIDYTSDLTYFTDTPLPRPTEIPEREAKAIFTRYLDKNPKLIAIRFVNNIEYSKYTEVNILLKKDPVEGSVAGGGAGGGRYNLLQVAGAQAITFYSNLEKEINNAELNKGNPDAKSIDKIFKDYEDDPIFGLDIHKITSTDRAVFIALTYIIRGVVLFLLNWGINSNMITNFEKAFLLYFTCYISIFIIIVILVNTENNLFFRLSLYYLDSKNNGWSRIILHIFMQLGLIPIIWMLKVNTDSLQITDFATGQRIYNIISTYTFFIWVFSSLIALKY